MILALAGADAAAHTFEPALLDLRERESGTFDVVWRPPAPESGALAPGAPLLQPRLPAACRTLAELEASDERIATRVACGAGRLRGETIAVPGLAASRIDAIVRVSWNDGQATSGVLTDAGESFVVPAGPRGILTSGVPAWTVATRYLGLGVEHILGGADHVLFVMGLFLLVGATRALVATVSAFTLAHSLTLAAAVLGIVTVPSAPVEALIAASIVLLARELVRGSDEPPTLARRFPWLMAFVFGLLHGLGFAGGLAETGVPADQIPLALLAFNLGVEIGQLGIVGALVALALLTPRGLRSGAARRWLPAYGLGSVASAWMIERIVRFWWT
ncbi:MAG: HupE/UreJ family protein [Deltaproteobacteria bacterium]|nr:HupE/UreJ family protein [Deltaproteobacteria bacterium]